MPEETHIPVLGNVKKKTAYIVGAGVVVLGGVLYWRHQAASTAASSATPADTSALNQDSSTYNPNLAGSYGGAASNYGGSYYGSGNITGYDQYGNPVYSTGIQGNLTITSNADWATQAETDLAANNVDQATAANAITRILAGLDVTTDQEDLFLQAVGLLGEPPQGYPKPIKVKNPNHHPPPVAKVTVPNVVGTDVEQATQILSAAGLKVSGPAGIPHVIHVVTSTNPRAGSSVNSGSTVKLSYKSQNENPPPRGKK